MHAVVCNLAFCLDINTQVYKHNFITLRIQDVEIFTATTLNSVVTAYMAFHETWCKEALAQISDLSLFLLSEVVCLSLK